MKTHDFINTAYAGRPIELHGAAKMLRDEVLGKLIHDNLLVSMESVGFTVTTLSAMPKADGSLLVFYAVRLTADELEALPSIYDSPPVADKPRKRTSPRRKAGKMAKQKDGTRTYRRPK